MARAFPPAAPRPRRPRADGAAADLGGVHRGTEATSPADIAELDRLILEQCWGMALDHHEKLVRAVKKRCWWCPWWRPVAVAALGKMVDFDQWKAKWKEHKDKYGLFASVTNEAYEVNGRHVWYKDGHTIHWLHPSVDRINNKKTYTFNNMHFPTVETQLRRKALTLEQVAEECEKMLHWRVKAGFP